MLYRYLWNSLYSRSIFCLPHWPKFSDIFDLCLHWVSVVRGTSNNRVTTLRKEPEIKTTWRSINNICHSLILKIILECSWCQATALFRVLSSHNEGLSSRPSRACMSQIKQAWNSPWRLRPKPRDQFQTKLTSWWVSHSASVFFLLFFTGFLISTIIKSNSCDFFLFLFLFYLFRKVLLYCQNEICPFKQKARMMTLQLWIQALIMRMYWLKHFKVDYMSH